MNARSSSVAEDLRRLLESFQWAGKPMKSPQLSGARAAIFLPREQNLQIVARSDGSVRPQAIIANIDLDPATSALYPGAELPWADEKPIRISGDNIVLPLIHDRRVAGVLAIDRLHSRIGGSPFSAEDASAARLLGDMILYRVIPPKRPSPHSTAVGEALAGIRRARHITQAALAERAGVGRIALSRWEAGAQPPTWRQLIAWCTALGVIMPTDVPIVQVIPNVTPELLRFLKEDPGRFAEITPEKFEEFAADRLTAMGYAVTRAGSTFRKDGGVDLIATRRDPVLGEFAIAGQVKHHRGDQKSGSADIQRLVWLKRRSLQLRAASHKHDFHRRRQIHRGKSGE